MCYGSFSHIPPFFMIEDVCIGIKKLASQKARNIQCIKAQMVKWMGKENMHVIHIYVNYRKFNVTTSCDMFSLPFLDNILNTVGDHEMYIFQDCLNDYEQCTWHRRVGENDIYRGMGCTFQCCQWSWCLASRCSSSPPFLAHYCQDLWIMHSLLHAHIYPFTKKKERKRVVEETNDLQLSLHLTF